MNSLKISSTTLVNWTLYGLILLLVIGVGFGAYVMHNSLSDFVTEVDHMKIDSEINEQGIDNAKRLRRALDDNKESVTRAAAIVADTKYYQYQDQIVEDISSYASASGLTVLGFDFSSASSGPTGQTAPTSSGLKTVVATVSLKSPVPYENYLRFLKLIERNLTKMQITQLDISSDLKSPGTISSPIITLEVFVQ